MSFRDEAQPSMSFSSNVPSVGRQTRYNDPDDASGSILAESILFNSRFAAGQVFTPELWGSMLGRMFYMPAIIELVEALVMPNRRGQTAFPWQFLVPPGYVGKTF